MIVFVRVDDRLIHGQVVLGWGRVLKPDRYVIIDDEVAETDWESELFMDAAPEGANVSILTVDEALKRFEEGIFDSERVFVLVKTPGTLLELVEKGFKVDKINIGGLHYSEGRERLTENIYLSKVDREALRELAKKGIKLEARALPESEKVVLNSMVI